MESSMLPFSGYFILPVTIPKSIFTLFNEKYLFSYLSSLAKFVSFCLSLCLTGVIDIIILLSYNR